MFLGEPRSSPGNVRGIQEGCPRTENREVGGESAVPSSLGLSILGPQKQGSLRVMGWGGEEGPMIPTLQQEEAVILD